MLLTLSSASFGMDVIEEVKVAIIGGGMSGLTAAHTLKKSGIKAVIFEGRDRLGGRTHTHYFNKEKTVFFEGGGTFINSDHTDTIKLAKKMGVKLIPRKHASRNIIGRYQEQFQSTKMLYSEIKKMHSELIHQIKIIDWDNALYYKEDSLEAYEKPLVPHLSNLNDFGKSFIQIYCEDEMGVSIKSAPIFTLKSIAEAIGEYKDLLKYKKNPLVPNTIIDKIVYDYTVEGGISNLVDSIVNKISPETAIHLNHILTHIEKKDQYILTFRIGDTIKQVRAERVIMTLPFSTLRHVSIDSSVGLSDHQKKSIKTLSYGTNSKVGIPMESSTSIPDEIFCYYNLDTKMCGWPGQNAFTLILGGEAGQNLNEKEANTIGKIHCPLIAQQYSKNISFGNPIFKNWSQDPFSLGSYSTHTINDDNALAAPSKIKGLEGMKLYAEPLNNFHFLFAGEHTTYGSSQSHIEGAVGSGKKAAKLLKKSIRG